MARATWGILGKSLNSVVYMFSDGTFVGVWSYASRIAGHHCERVGNHMCANGTYP